MLNKKADLLTALSNGKTLVWVSSIPRYYKLVNDTVIYSDDLKQWLASNLKADQLTEISELEVL